MSSFNPKLKNGKENAPPKSKAGKKGAGEMDVDEEEDEFEG